MSKIIFFDGDCALCDASMRFIIRRDTLKQFQFEPLQSDAAKKTLHAYGIDSNLNDTIILLDEGVLYKLSDAALRICSQLSGPVKYLYVLRFIPSAIRNVVYRIVAKHRYKWFGKAASCELWIETDIKKTR